MNYIQCLDAMSNKQIQLGNKVDDLEIMHDLISSI
jgi:hypothetical protein